MLLYLSFNNTFKDVYNVLGLSVIILYFDNVMKTPTLYDSKLHTNAHRATEPCSEWNVVYSGFHQYTEPTT